MILSNYWKALHSLKDLMSNSGEANMIDYGMIGLDGNDYGTINMGWDTNGDYSVVFKNVKLRTDGISVRIGTGTGEVSVTDYSLFNDITSNISDVVVSNNYIPSREGYKQILTITGINPTAEAITITEAGITKAFYAHPAQKDPLLLAKTVLTKPIKVEPGDSFSLSLEWLEA